MAMGMQILAEDVTTRPWRPHAGQQERFLSSPAYEALFGGAAGPGKTECLLREALRQVDNPHYRAILFRRIFPSLEAADGLIDRSLRCYTTYGGRYNDNKHVWIFPSGARIYFGHMQYEDDKYLYQGAQFGYIGFDELTEFTESQYLYLMSRSRAPSEAHVRVYVRAATNPGNIGHGWVKRRLITTDIRDRIRCFALIDGKDTAVGRDHPSARSRAFYPARLSDNPSITADYERNILLNPDAVERARLLEGDWDAERTEGRIYDTWTADNISAGAEYNPDLPVYWGADDGYVLGDGTGHGNYHPRVILFVQDNPLGGLDVFDELVVTGEQYDATLDRALALPYRSPSLAWIDGSAAAFRGALDARGLHSAVGTHRVVEGIRVVRQLICDGSGVRRLRVNPRCQNLIYEMGEYRTDPKARAEGGEIVPLKLSDHGQDALRYVAFNKRGAL